MQVMRDLTDSFKVSVRGLPEVEEALSRMKTWLTSEESIRFVRGGEGKKPTKAAIVCALLLRVATLPKEEREALIGEGMTMLNGALASDERLPLDSLVPSEEVLSAKPVSARPRRASSELKPPKKGAG